MYTEKKYMCLQTIEALVWVTDLTWFPIFKCPQRSELLSKLCWRTSVFVFQGNAIYPRLKGSLIPLRSRLIPGEPSSAHLQWDSPSGSLSMSHLPRASHFQKNHFYLTMYPGGNWKHSYLFIKTCYFSLGMLPCVSTSFSPTQPAAWQWLDSTRAGTSSTELPAFPTNTIEVWVKIRRGSLRRA